MTSVIIHYFLSTATNLISICCSRRSRFPFRLSTAAALSRPDVFRYLRRKANQGCKYWSVRHRFVVRRRRAAQRQLRRSGRNLLDLIPDSVRARTSGQPELVQSRRQIATARGDMIATLRRLDALWTAILDRIGEWPLSRAGRGSYQRSSSGPPICRLCQTPRCRR